jgi:DNA repair protein RadC
MSKSILYTTDENTATGIREASFDEILAAARKQISHRVRRGTSLTSPKATRDYLSLKLGTLEREVFAVIFLDKRHRLISVDTRVLNHIIVAGGDALSMAERGFL